MNTNLGCERYISNKKKKKKRVTFMEGAYFLKYQKVKNPCKFLLTSELNESTQTKTTIQYRFEHDQNKRGWGTCQRGS